MVFNIRRFRSERVTGEVAAADVTVARPRATPSERIVGFITRTPVHLGLIVIAVIWLVPTVGLAVTSFRPRGEIQSSSWWSSLTHPDFTLENYTDVLNRGNMDTAFVNSLIITIPATLLPLTLAALAAYAFSWIAFPFRDTIFLVDRRADDRSGADGARAAADALPGAGDRQRLRSGSGSRTRRSACRSGSSCSGTSSSRCRAT